MVSYRFSQMLLNFNDVQPNQRNMTKILLPLLLLLSVSAYSQEKILGFTPEAAATQTALEDELDNNISADNLDQIPMGRYGSVNEIAKTVRFLVSEDAGYITGQNIRADGGLTHSIQEPHAGRLQLR
jgi:NAD(P)-dependent dehydrogenase (short-subunit alcohol dehydrogenase family)